MGSIRHSICSQGEHQKENVNVCLIFVECPDGKSVKERTKVTGGHTYKLCTITTETRKKTKAKEGNDQIFIQRKEQQTGTRKDVKQH